MAHGQKHYVKIWGILVVLFVISVLGPTLEIKIVTLVTAFGIALVKAYLVIKHFMHLNVEKAWIHWLMATSLVLMVLFFAGVAPDVLNHEGTNWVNESAKAATARGIHDPVHGEEHGAAPDHGAAQEQGGGHH